MPQNVYEDSYVTMWHGPRRGGKSASMAYEVMANLLAGKRVFADSPVSFNFQIDEKRIHHYESEPLNYLEFLQIDDPTFKRKYSNSVIAWDEVDKWLFNRNFQSVFNKINSQFITMIGKLEMTFLMTAQFIGLVERNIVRQIDNEARCVDLSFKYPHLERGSTIGQMWRDVSGRTTGEMFEYNDEEYQQTFYAKTVWPIYNTKHTPSLLDSMQKIKIEQPTKLITVGDIQDVAGSNNYKEIQTTKEYGLTQDEQNYSVSVMLADEIKALKKAGIQEEFSRQDILIMARERGYRGSNYILFNELSGQDIAPIRRGILAPV